ncbi:pilin [Fangia hongkongensis]|uniref:pilin n=1 Tax=Fangia hongkongensis TaxID=270495 RepID=UPI00038276F9|nr:prepilin-type N-terminal cleavage/methylation domain-containing protein [Fangia hongkongensis]MBK2126214.1 prepilin-type N-terminal cleavage/methylation domain-containing protein [Fangia hongkongensis]
MRKYRRQHGVSLIEIMITIAVIAILGTIAVPVYFSYAKEAELSGALPVIGAVEQKIADYRQQNGTFDGANNTSLDIDSQSTVSDVISSLTIENGIITIALLSKYSDDSNDANPRWLFEPTVIENAVVWLCASTSGITCPEGYGISSQTIQFPEAPAAVPPPVGQRLPNTLVYSTPQNLTSLPGGGRNGGAIVYLGDGDDQIDTRGADDIVYAGGGNDIIELGTYFDNIDAGSGDDIVNGGWGFDIIYGGSGADTIDGGERNDNWKQTDTLVYVKPREAYLITAVGNPASGGEIHVQDLDTGEIDIVTNIEEFKFGYNKSLTDFDVGEYEHKTNGRNDSNKKNIANTDDFDESYVIEYRDNHAQEGQINQSQLDALLGI